MIIIVLQIYDNNSLCKDTKKATQKSCLTVGILGLEPRMAGPESAVLPLHHIPMRTALISVVLNCVCKGSAFL